MLHFLALTSLKVGVISSGMKLWKMLMTIYSKGEKKNTNLVGNTVRIEVPTRERKILIQFTLFALIKVAISGFMVEFDAYQKSV